MQIVETIAQLGDFGSGSAVAIGNFDGVHLGHQVLLNKAMELAQKEGLKSVAYTFEPHPAKLFRPDLAPAMIDPMSVRLERLAKCGIDITFIQPFDLEFSRTSPEEFIQSVLVEKLKARHVIIGEGFVFGRDQTGSTDTLERQGPHFDFEVHPQKLIRVDGIPASSTRIRDFVHEGNLPGATLLLGRPYQLRGQVIEGAKRGRQLGIPTANISPANELLPRSGVYACIAHSSMGTAQAVVNIGFNPTFAENELKIEAHLLDTPDADLYGTELRLDFLGRLRGEIKFKAVENLIAQIKQDIEEARQLLDDLAP